MPVTLTREPYSIQLTHNLDVQRRVGRPNSTVREGTKEHPYLVDRQRAAADVFELSGEFYSDAADAAAENLCERVIRPPLGYNTLSINFHGMYGMDSYRVVPEGSRAVRVSWAAGETDVVSVDTLALRVVDNP